MVVAEALRAEEITQEEDGSGPERSQDRSAGFEERKPENFLGLDMSTRE